MEIYDNVAQIYPLPYPSEQMAEMELETERQMLVPIVATRELINQLRKEGDILFISDMYLPSAFIKELLTKHGFFQEGDRLYVSDELGAWKHDGSLYRLVHERESISYRSWHHYGDNRHSDCTVPRRLGIHAHYIHFDYLPYEDQWRQHPVLQYQYPAILAGVARAIRLSSDAPDDLTAFVCDISAPLMVSWVTSILDDAIAHGIKSIYFCARDTHSEFVIARTLTRCNDRYKSISVFYLFVSTTALSDKLCLEYFKQEGLASKQNDVAIVDSRGRGYFVSNINLLLHNNGYCRVRTYMLQYCPTELDTSQNINSVVHNTLYLDTYGRQAKALNDLGWMIENIFSLNHHSKTIGYHNVAGRIRPLFSNKDIEITALDIHTLKCRQDAILTNYTTACSICHLPLFNQIIFPSLIVPTLTEYAKAPRKTYLDYLTRISIYGKRNTFVHNVFHYTNTKGGHWVTGCIHYTFPPNTAYFISKVYKKIIKQKRVN